MKSIAGPEPQPSPDAPAETPATQPKESSTQPTAWLAHIIRPKKDGSIDDLTLPETQLPIVMVRSGQRFRPMIEVPLSFDRPGWSLLIQGTIPVTPTTTPGKHKIFAYMNGKINEMLLVARSPTGESLSERIYIYAPEAQEFNVVSPWDAVKLTVGSTYLAYKQTGFNDFYSWSGLLSAQIHSPEEGARFGFLGELSMTALTVASNQGKYGPQMGHGVLDGIYFFPWVTNSLWRLQAVAGVNYLTMFSNGAPFGFNNLIAPDLGLRTRYILDGKSDIISEFRFIPMSTSLNLNERGLTLSISKSWILPNLHRGELGIKFDELQYKPVPLESVSLRTLSFVISYGL